MPAQPGIGVEILHIAREKRYRFQPCPNHQHLHQSSASRRWQKQRRRAASVPR